MKQDPDQVLLQLWVLAAQAGDRSALDRLIRRLHPLAMAHARRLLGDVEAAADASQEAMLAVARGLSGLTDPGRVASWMYRITTHKCRDWQRRDYRVQRDRSLAVDVTDAAVAVEVHEVLAQLTTVDRALLSLFYLHGLAIQELAEVFDLQPGAVKTRLYRARQRFKTYWEGDNE